MPEQKTKKPRNRLGAKLRARGFDKTEYDRREGAYLVRCSQCQAMVVNGCALHEEGCPHDRQSNRD